MLAGAVGISSGFAVECIFAWNLVPTFYLYPTFQSYTHKRHSSPFRQTRGDRNLSLADREVEHLMSHTNETRNCPAIFVI